MQELEMKMVGEKDAIERLDDAIKTAKPVEAVGSEIGHQGDVNFTQARQLKPADREALKAVNGEVRAVVSAGRYGSHVMIGKFTPVKDGLAVEDATLYHTDVPNSRHDAVKFGPGVWTFWPHAEVLGGDVIQQKD
jgi:fatty acid/phospholipid biosynthesis enzyme